MPQSGASVATHTAVRPFYGFVETTGDALRIIEAARRGILPRVTRRLNDTERRTMIKSGAVFVFSVDESGIKRWTEGLTWSQSRISGNFLLYREVSDRNTRTFPQTSGTPEVPRGGQGTEGPLAFKPRGLIKKTITVKIDGSDHHLISYYTQEDVDLGRLQRPTCRPDLLALEIPPELTQSTNFRYPPRLEETYEDSPCHSQTHCRDGIDNQSERTPGFASASPRANGIVASRAPGQNSSALSQAAFSHPPANSSDLVYHDQSHFSRSETAYQDQQDTISVVRIPVQQGSFPYRIQAGSSGTQAQATSSTWGALSQSPYESFPATSTTSVAYHNPSHVSHIDPTYPQSQGSWVPHSQVPTRMALDPMAAGGNSSGAQPWPQGQLEAHSASSAPPVSYSMVANLPTGRSREHMRTRSSPSTWSWNTAGTVPTPYQVPPQHQEGFTSVRECSAGIRTAAAPDQRLGIPDRN